MHYVLVSVSLETGGNTATVKPGFSGIFVARIMNA
jgi:hypothetical protein